MRTKPSEAETIELAESSIHDGITLGSRGLCNDAIEALDKAVAVCQNFKGHSDAVTMLMAAALGNKGAALGDLDRLAEAVECYDAAIEIYRQLVKRDRSAGLVGDYAVSTMNKGWALINLGREEEGFRCHEEALTSSPARTGGFFFRLWRTTAASRHRIHSLAAACVRCWGPRAGRARMRHALSSPVALAHRAHRPLALHALERRHGGALRRGE